MEQPVDIHIQMNIHLKNIIHKTIVKWDLFVILYFVNYLNCSNVCFDHLHNINNGNNIIIRIFTVELDREHNMMYLACDACNMW